MIRNAASQAIVAFLGILEPKNWPECLQHLFNMLESLNLEQQEVRPCIPVLLASQPHSCITVCSSGRQPSCPRNIPISSASVKPRSQILTSTPFLFFLRPPSTCWTKLAKITHESWTLRSTERGHSRSSSRSSSPSPTTHRQRCELTQSHVSPLSCQSAPNPSSPTSTLSSLVCSSVLPTRILQCEGTSANRSFCSWHPDRIS